MTRTVAFVEAPHADSTTGNAARRLGGQSLLERVVRRVSESQRISDVLIIPGDGCTAEGLASIAPPDVGIFTGTQRDLLARYAAAARQYKADAVIRVSTENAFVDPAFIDRLVICGDDHPGCDYISYHSRDGRPVVLSALGVFAEWCRADALFQADREAKDTAVRGDVTRYLYSHPEKFRLRLIPVPEELDRSGIRLRIRDQADLELAEMVCDALGQHDADWERIANLLN